VTLTSDNKERNIMAHRSARLLLSVVLVGSLGETCFVPGTNAADGDTTKDVLAAQIRTQGVACERPKRAVRDVKQSRPDHDVWILTCENATYRISRYPDLAAKIEKIR
jgi:hypothetical protein